MVPLAQPAAAQLPTATESIAASPPTSADRAGHTTRAGAESDRPARTAKLSLGSLQTEERGADDTTTAGTARLGPREVARFSMLGVVWDDAEQELPARVEVRTRARGGDAWSKWAELENHSTDAPDAQSAERAAGTIRGSTAPLWVGDSDAVDVRIVPSGDQGTAALPEGLHLSLIDPGGDRQTVQPSGRAGGPASSGPRQVSHAEVIADHTVTTDGKSSDPQAQNTPGGAENAGDAPLSDASAERIPPQSQAELAASRDARGEAAAPIGPRPGIVTRSGWGANESWREPGFSYTTTVKSAFVHHTAESNNYTCAQAPSVIRGIYQYHVRSLGWRDIGYNFLVDKCGKIYEGRAGGVAKAVLGAHTYGFNSNTTGIAVLGSFGSTAPPKAAVEGVSKLIAWKLGLHGLNPVGSVTLTSGGGKWPAGTKVKMRAVAGHRDGFSTECPGALLYNKLDSIRDLAARLQGR